MRRKPPVLILRCSWCFELFTWKPRKASKIKNGPKLCCSRGHLSKLQARENKVTQTATVCPKCGERKKRESRQCLNCRFPRPILQQPEGEWRLIPLTQGKIAMVDVDDYERFGNVRWQARLNPTSGLWYAIRSIHHPEKKISIQMHREVMRLENGDPITVDHREPRSTLDNRKSNLRLATVSEQERNKRKTRSNTSGFKGVSYDKKARKFRASICLFRKAMHLGFFNSAEEAHAAYVKAAATIHGEFARTD